MIGLWLIHDLKLACLCQHVSQWFLITDFEMRSSLYTERQLKVVSFCDGSVLDTIVTNVQCLLGVPVHCSDPL